MVRSDPRIPPARHCVIRELLEQAAQAHPDRAFARFASGASAWRYGELRSDVVRTAHALRRLGVRQQDRVLLWLGTSRLAIRCWLALGYLGAVCVPLNPAYRGNLLAHVVRRAEARLMIAHANLMDRLEVCDILPQTMVAVGGAGAEALAGKVTLLTEEALDSEDETLPELANPIAAWDCPVILFTSGTTGPSKAVETSYAQFWASANAGPFLAGADDCTLLHLPLFHVAGAAVVYRALVSGGCVGVVEDFRTQTFWRDVRRTGATFANIMGSMAAFLLGLPESEEERHTTLRHALMSPMSETCIALAKRVGFDYHTVFNMTEVSRPLMTEINRGKTGSCGKPRPGIEARIVDAHDGEVPRGDVGELIIRADAPWTFFSAYFGDPQATSAAWRNGWFHTGDAFRMDADGDFIFVDRTKDSIRRRGENISSMEVEAEAAAHPAVRYCAAVAVPSAHGDDEVLLAIEPHSDVDLDPSALLAFLMPRMPHFMVPRYIRLVKELPRTETQRIKKIELRQQGVTPDTWDREEAGIVVRRTAVPRG